jgi:hypothetical protein
MDDAMLMRVLHGFTDLNHQCQALAGIETLRIGVFDQRLAVNEFHGEERLNSKPGIGTARLVDLRDAGVMKTTECLGFQFEAPEHLRAGPSGPDHFQRDVATRLILFYLVYRPHPALAEQADYASPVRPLWPAGV